MMKKFFEYLFLMICIHLCIGAWWITYEFGKVSGDEMLFHLLVPLNGINNDCYISYFLLAVIPTIIVAGIAFFFIHKYLKERRKIIYPCLFFLSLLFFIFKLDLHSYIYDQVVQSNFIEDNYVDTAKVNIEFPEQKRNLIFIFMESMETTYASSLDGGVKSKSLIPNLTKVAKENTSFSNSKKLGGALGLNGSAWTVASMVSQTSGLPLKINFSGNGIIDFENFMPDVLTLGDILSLNGYDNYLIAGSDTSYGGRKSYFEKHGNYHIYDVNSALEDGRIQGKVWWGFDDNHLFEFAQEKLLEIADKGRPFNYTMLTVDTHFEDGYLSDECEKLFDDQYSNVIYCSDQKIYHFLEWLKQQDFYENTTVVLVGDHKSMDTDYFNKVSKNYVRTTYNVFINSVVDTDNLYDRQFTALDMFPTTLASIGVNIENNKLGLGVNLFSDEKSLVEKYGYSYVFDELKKRSTFYNNHFLAYK